MCGSHEALTSEYSQNLIPRHAAQVHCALRTRTQGKLHVSEERAALSGAHLKGDAGRAMLPAHCIASAGAHSRFCVVCRV